MNRVPEGRLESAACEVVEFGDYRIYGFYPGRVFTLQFRYPRRLPPRWLVSLMGEEEVTDATPRGLWKTEDVHFQVHAPLPTPYSGWQITTCHFEVLGWGAQEQELVITVEPAGSRERGLIMSLHTWQECFRT